MLSIRAISLVGYSHIQGQYALTGTANIISFILLYLLFIFIFIYLFCSGAMSFVIWSTLGESSSYTLS